jgi:type I restriction enzyme S subunit
MLYYWFVQFDFPDENDKPYKSSGGKMVWCDLISREIPVGWETGVLGDWMDFQRGISYKKSDIGASGKPFINLDSFKLSGEFKMAGTKRFSGNYKEASLIPKDSLIIAITDVTRNADIIGRAFHLPDVFEDEVLMSCDVARILPFTIEFGRYLEMLFNSHDFHNYIKHFATGTLVLHLNLDGIRWFKLAKPDNRLLSKFAKIKKSIGEQKANLSKQNQELATLRDWLLPMLMNGQVTVATPENTG